MRGSHALTLIEPIVKGDVMCIVACTEQRDSAPALAQTVPLAVTVRNDAILQLTLSAVSPAAYCTYRTGRTLTFI